MNLPVFANGMMVGAFLSGETGASFRYATAWRRHGDAFPVSLSMPLRQEIAGPETATPWRVSCRKANRCGR